MELIRNTTLPSRRLLFRVRQGGGVDEQQMEGSRTRSVLRILKTVPSSMRGAAKTHVHLCRRGTRFPPGVTCGRVKRGFPEQQRSFDLTPDVWYRPVWAETFMLLTLA